MNVLNSSLYLSDIEKATKSLDWIEFPNDKTFLVTGASGLICSSVVDLLVNLAQNYKLNWKIFLAGRNEEKIHNRFLKYFNDKNVSFINYEIEDPCHFPSGINYLIHGAGNAYPAAFAKEPAETLYLNILGMHQVLSYAIQNKTRVVYISSSEVYGQLQNNEPITESDSGYIDLLNSRSSYPMGKRAAETLCASFIQEYAADCTIVRPGHIYGPTASKEDNRVSSVFMFNAANGKNLILKSKGEQKRSYCYCIDCASAIIATLFKGEIGEAYNISNKNSLCSIKEMAEAFAKSGNVSVNYDLPSETEKKNFNQMLNSTLNSEKIEKLGWQPSFSKQEGFDHSIKIVKELNLN